MGFIPADARWYVADVVLEHRVDGDARNVVHVDTHRIEAGSPDEAYEKAMELGRGADCDYANPADQRVRVMFRGLRVLNVIHEPLEDGAELMYEEKVGVSEERLREWATPKERPGVFAPIDGKFDGPNSMPGDAVFRSIVEALERCEGDVGPKSERSDDS